ncbi:MAG: DNA-directed RNA polymerase subunit alpha [Deltaproteobacteria bacterium]|nr:DNA-directed RNA polymerase subunit alpha [Deltaproteobacteria bacterium]MCL5276914.1 DNA-directed RNA polymerase subunit alpha [Deltaproteobacteria bacterium]
MIHRNLQPIVKPKRVLIDSNSLTETYGKFTIEPLERGYGTTIGNALRRILLSSIEGAAITSVKIEGVTNEFSTIPGVDEDVMEIILNLKTIRFKLLDVGEREIKIRAKGEMVITGKDIIIDDKVTILTPDTKIATLHKDSVLNADMIVKVGRGYIPSEENKDDNMPIGVIPIDSIFSPIKRMNFQVRNSRVGRIIDYDKLIIEVWTDGSIEPRKALITSAGILSEQLSLFSEEIIEHNNLEIIHTDGGHEDSKLTELLNKNIDELEFSVRATNCLKNANIKTIGELVLKTEQEILQMKNFGRKSLSEIKDVLSGMGLKLGMKPLGMDATEEKEEKE